jgi:hypothetical protein
MGWSNTCQNSFNFLGKTTKTYKNYIVTLVQVNNGAKDAIVGGSKQTCEQLASAFDWCSISYFINAA